jgi:acylphosphatase
VSNLLDGRVEAVFEGPAEAVDKMVKFCHKGPRGARVEEVEIYEEEPQDEFDDFRIKY